MTLPTLEKALEEARDGSRELERARIAFSGAEDLHMNRHYETAANWYLRSIALSLLSVARSLQKEQQG